MGMKEEMEEFKERPKHFVNAEFVEDGNMKIEINASFVNVLALAMSLLEHSMERDEELTLRVLEKFINKEYGKGK